MKRMLFNLGTPVAAFIIGIAINDACADNLTKTSNGGLQSDSELRNLVEELQKEVNSLKSRVSELEQKAEENDGKATSGGYAFEVNGLHFGIDGQCCDPIKSLTWNDSYTIYQTGDRVDNPSTTTYTYEYDSFGRLSASKTRTDTYERTSNYSYGDKTETIHTVTKYSSDSSISESGITQTSHFE